MSGRIRVGTSSWADPGFVEEWYPPGLPAHERLAWYAEHFDTVEVNSTFYAVPGEPQVRGWAERTPDGFAFDVKLHRLLSRHAAGLDSLPVDLREGATLRGRGQGRVVVDRDIESALVERTAAALEPLQAAGKLRALLLQLSPAFAPEAHRLEELEPLLGDLGGLAPVAIELRHRAWLKPDRIEATLGWYERAGAVWVAVDAPQGASPTMMPPVDTVTRGELAYLRAHGRNAEGYARGRSVPERFAHRYSDAELEEIAGRARALAEDAREVHVAFNNNRGDDAPVAAARFGELVG
ncbi:MAG: hypothetical protein QOK21_3335 [Solirubrobacteraceae bacterium]|jgi:uncharacterized protein YecE (DUF72 family)|nr:hypothetical protein [Solirubrobacteraceae bacterium]